MIRRIVVATGGSDWSDHALRYALDFAARYRVEEVVVVYVVPPTAKVTVDPMGMVVLPPTPEAVPSTTGQEVLARAEADARARGVLCRTVLREGPVADQIVRVASEERADLVVVGSRGLTGIRRLLLGSISNEVAVKAPCPVMIVKQPHQDVGVRRGTPL
jgi:nucleotide-binding universal stress UspA family protein